MENWEHISTMAVCSAEAAVMSTKPDTSVFMASVFSLGNRYSTSILPLESENVDDNIYNYKFYLFGQYLVVWKKKIHDTVSCEESGLKV